MDYLSFRGHCTSALIIRFVLVIYSDYHDQHFSVPYTDVDYKVYTDAARFLLTGGSPYDRHTYRYTPLLALLLTPNLLIHRNFGKILFSVIDIAVGILIRHLLLKGQCETRLANISGLLWLYCPLTIVVSTRGNADSVAVALVLLTLYYLINDSTFIAGIFHGVSVHFRLYPIAFSLSMYLALSSKKTLIPNKSQLKLVSSCALSLIFLTGINYYFYGYEFLYESFIYHLIRKDTRHNFSVYFYMQYLSIGQQLLMFEKILRFLPQIILLAAISFRYSDKRHLAFAMLTQAMIMVSYNSVITSQYFFWYLSLLPLSLPYIRIHMKKLLGLLVIWILSQGLWLYDAYLLEFLGINSFQSIWIDSLIFYIVNIIIVVYVISNYDNTMKLSNDLINKSD